MTEDIKKEEVKEEEATETTEEVVEEVSEPSELEEAQARAEEFENKYLRAHAEMQNIQRRANEERQQLQKYRSQDLAKAILPSLDNLERALAVEGLTDDVKKGLEMVQESLVHALKEEGIEEIPGKLTERYLRKDAKEIWSGKKVTEGTEGTEEVESHGCVLYQMKRI